MSDLEYNKKLDECLDAIAKNPHDMQAFEQACNLVCPRNPSKACDLCFQAIIHTQTLQNEQAYKSFKEKRGKIKEAMREEYRSKGKKDQWEDIEDFIADNHETLDSGSLKEYISLLENHMKIKDSETYQQNPYLELFNSIVHLVPPRYIQPKTFALTSDLKLLPQIILEDRKKKGKWPEGLTKEDIMDDFNENYICFNGLIVPRDYLLFFKYIRTPMTHFYSWAIPNNEALECIKSRGPIVEIGAGSGYWAYLLRKQGVDVVALDLFPPSSGSNPSHKVHHTSIEHGGPNDLEKYSDRTLLLCWPDDYHSSDKQMFTFAADCLAHYKGKCIIYIGDWKGTALGASEYGYTSSREFQDRLQREFSKVQRIFVPNWPMVADDLTVWERRA
eukprot:Phypoly_transcript_10945.p1 GENE.Phypoly_transcript_10945~~Phypoly_transcript_10945.p1  ORF type:complete len:410 (-),score=36.33 Phypoly_transcript_10945:31-1194(-)